jgi:hypothetical protein
MTAVGSPIVPIDPITYYPRYPIVLRPFRVEGA